MHDDLPPPPPEADRDAITAQHFPMTLPGELIARPIDLDTYFNVAQQLDALIFTPLPMQYTLPAERHLDKRHLYAQQQGAHQEAIAIMVDDEHAVGYVAGRTLGALVYLIDRCALLPAVQGQGIGTAFLRQYVAYLTAYGYEHVVGYCAPTNRAALIAGLKAGFMVSGMEISDDGPLVKLLYVCHDDRRASLHMANNLPE
jgi:RimJ/RimL family protein N-acetyltransferase